MHTEGQGGKVWGLKPLHFSINSQGGGLDSGTQRHNVHTEPTDTTMLAAKKEKDRVRQALLEKNSYILLG